MKWLIERYRVQNHFGSIREVAEACGFDYQRLLKRLNNPETFKVFEIRALDNVLHFKESDLVDILRGDLEE